MKNVQFSSMYVGDLHGRIGCFESAIEKFEKSGLERLVLMGDYMDSFDCTSTEILYLLQQVIEYKKSKPQQVILLLGNHDIQYIYSPDYRCSGHRPEIQYDAYKLFRDNEPSFQIAWLNGDYMATHAGILSNWYYTYNNRLHYYQEKFGIDKIASLDVLLNAINRTSDNWILNTVHSKRGGSVGSIGGPLWADMTEIKERKVMHRYSHIVGHNPVPSIIVEQNTENSEVVFTDCLGSKEEFFTLKND